MALHAENIPKSYRKRGIVITRQANFRSSFDQMLLWLTGYSDTRKVALDVGGEYGDAGARRTPPPAPVMSRFFRCRSRR